MTKPLLAIALVLGAAALAHAARLRLTGVHSDVLPAWPSQVIFGLYFAILTLAIQALQRIGERAQPRPRQALLLLVLIGVCADIVLINVQEIKDNVDASYGLVVIWDVATFFVWLRVIDLALAANDTKFQRSWTVMVAPLLAVGREILFVPYQADLDSLGLAYFDLLFGDLLILLWVFIPLRHAMHDQGAVERRLVFLVFLGCTYYFVSAMENALGLAWAPFEDELRSVLRHLGLPIPVLNCFQFALALALALAIVQWDVLGLGSRVGIARQKVRRRP